jgi:hypothetical protein
MRNKDEREIDKDGTAIWKEKRRRSRLRPLLLTLDGVTHVSIV